MRWRAGKVGSHMRHTCPAPTPPPLFISHYLTLTLTHPSWFQLIFIFFLVVAARSPPRVPPLVMAKTEWLRLVPAKYMGCPYESSNLSGDISCFLCASFARNHLADCESLNLSGDMFSPNFACRGSFLVPFSCGLGA
jgi:hypothetical protein